VSVDYSVSMVSQSTDHSGWAAATAMVLNYNGGSYDDMEVIYQLQERFPDDVWDEGSRPVELGQVAYHFGLTQLLPSTFSPEIWDDLLKSNGALLIGVPGDPHRAYVISGINIVDGAEESATVARIHVLDPLLGDEWVPYDSFVQRFETTRSDFAQNMYKY